MSRLLHMDDQLHLLETDLASQSACSSHNSAAAEAMLRPHDDAGTLMVWACPKGWPACPHSWNTSPWRWEGTRPFTGAAVALDGVCPAPCLPGNVFALHHHAVSSCFCMMSCSRLSRARACDHSIVAQTCPCLTWTPVQDAGGPSTKTACQAQQHPADSSSRLKQEVTS